MNIYFVTNHDNLYLQGHLKWYNIKKNQKWVTYLFMWQDSFRQTLLKLMFKWFIVKESQLSEPS